MATRKKVLSAVVGALMLTPLLLTACGSTGNTPQSPSGPVKGGSLTDGLIEEPDTLIPMLTNETYAVMVDQAIWAPLWYGDPQGQLHPGIADIPTSTDLKTWTIKLHPNLKWSDGSPLTADDLAFSLNLYANPKFANTFGFPTTDPKDPVGVASVTKVDNLTVTLTLRNPDVTIPSLLADGSAAPIPQKVFGSIDPSQIAKSPQNFQPTVDSGPFVISNRVQGDHITLTPNPNYYQPGLPYLSQLTFKIIQDSNTMLTALQSHTIDTSWFLDSTKLAAYKDISGYTVTTDSNPAGYELLVFNECSQVGVKGCARTSILQDKAIRQAITMGIQVTGSGGLIDSLYNGIAKPTCDDSAGTFAHQPDLTCDQYNPSQAKSILQNDGWTMGSDGYFQKNGKDLELVYATTTKATREQTQLIVQQELKQVGIKIDIKNYQSADFFGTQSSGILHSGNYDIGEFAETLTYDPDDHTLWMCNQTPDVGGSNYMRYCNQAVDQAEQQQQGTDNQATRKAAFNVIHTNILNDSAVMFLFVAANIAIHNNKVGNYNPSALGPSETWNVWDWYIAH